MKKNSIPKPLKKNNYYFDIFRKGLSKDLYIYFINTWRNGQN